MTAVVFDLDGVLIDSEPLWRRSYQEVARARYGVVIEERLFDDLQGLRADAVVERLLAHVGRSSVAESRAMLESVLDRVANLVRQERPLIEPSLAVLRQIAAAGQICGLASSSPRALIEVELACLDAARVFKAVCSAFDEAHGKPHPAVYLRVASALAVPPESCIVIEDSPSGVAAAAAAGMRTVGLLRSGQFPPRVVAACSLVVTRLDALDVDALARGDIRLRRCDHPYGIGREPPG